MKKLITLIMVTFSAISSLSFASTLNSMDKAAVEHVILDKTLVSIATDNLNGRTIKNTFSMYLDKHGNMFGRMSHKPVGEPQTDKGVYSITSDGTFYFTWQHWDGGKKLCGHLFNTKNAYISIDCSNVFHTAFMKDSIQPGNQLR